MSTLKPYVVRFFDELEVYEDIAHGHSFKAYMKGAVHEFLRLETKASAFAVYHAFFDSYRIRLVGETNPFIDLLDILGAYEENAATLIDKQRDHYVHSVYVFLLGLSIYIGNDPFQRAFAGSLQQPLGDHPFYSTRHEEFYFRWGIAALFHDIGYPVEIIAKQIDKYMRYITDVDGDEVRVRSHLVFENFHELNAVAEVKPKGDFIDSYYNTHKSCVYVDLLKPIDLLAHKVHVTMGVDVRQIKHKLDTFTDDMAKMGFVDHGYYGAIVVLKWYGYLIQQAGLDPDRFFYQVLDSASAILMHNFYRNVLRKPPFDLPPLSAEKHPLAFLLMLCDELQEWNRKPYGIIDRKRAFPTEAEVLVTDTELRVSYFVVNGQLPPQFAQEKEEFLHFLLDIDGLFPDGLHIACHGNSKGRRQRIKESGRPQPRPLLENIEKLAIAVHQHYNQTLLAKDPGAEIVYPTFADLPDDMKYSNIRQAMQIPDKLAMAGLTIAPIDPDRERVTAFDPEMLEALAEVEHDKWCEERIESGWVLGPVKDPDPEHRITPWLIPYAELPEDIKALDREAVRAIPALIDMIGGMAIYEESEA